MTKKSLIKIKVQSCSLGPKLSNKGLGRGRCLIKYVEKTTGLVDSDRETGKDVFWSQTNHVLNPGSDKNVKV